MSDAGDKADNVVDDLFGTLRADAEKTDSFSLKDLIDAFGRRAYGPVFFVIGVIAVSPLGAIPGASIFFATAIVVLAAQYALRDGAPVLPGFLAKRSVDGSKVVGALDAVQPYARIAGKLLRERARRFVGGPWVSLPAVALVAFAATMYPLALIPGGVSVPGTAVAIIGLAIAAADGAALISAIGCGVLISAALVLVAL